MNSGSLITINSIHPPSINERLNTHSITQKPLNKNNCLKNKTKIKDLIINQIAFKTLLELSVSLLCMGATCCFLASGALVPLVASVAAATIVNIFLRCAAGHLTYQKVIEPQNWTDVDELLLKLLMFATATNFSCLYSTTADVLIHEGGHALAGKYLYENAKITVKINPPHGGWTSFSGVTGYTRLGQLLGERKAEMIISGAGTGMTIISSSLFLIAAYSQRKKNPELSLYLKSMAICSLANSILYALSSFGSTTPGHDFYHLWSLGIHPLASIAAIVALPIIIKTGVFLYDYYQRSPSVPNATVSSLA